jgi:hypothetical protein
MSHTQPPASRSCRTLLPLALCAALLGAALAQPPAQSGSSSSSARSASSSSAAAADPYVPDGRAHDLQGATAECRDGTLNYDGVPSTQTCLGHGGVRHWLQGRGQDLLRGP